MALGERSRKGKSLGGSLEPFRGLFTPPLSFDSDYAVMLVDFAKTPTAVSAYSEVWVVAPDDERTLFLDHPEAATDVRRYHEYDHLVPATMDWTWDGEDDLRVEVRGASRTFDLTLTVTRTLRTRLLDAATLLTPASVAHSRVGTTLATLSLRSLFDVNGLRTAGETDTGVPYRTEANRLARVTGARARLDGDDLGVLVDPELPVAFGDIVAPDDPLVIHGALWMPVA